MAVFRGNVYSQTLDLHTYLTVVLPETPRRAPLKTLYLLHGMGQNADSWLDNTTLLSAIAGKDVAVVMPDGHRGFYTSMKYGMQYGEFFADELPRICETMFGLSPKREDRYLAGLSMGGYGAARLTLTHPDVFGHACLFSPAIDIFRFTAEKEAGRQRYLEAMGIFGETYAELEEADLFRILRRFSSKNLSKKPDFLVFCGRQDFRITENKRFADALCEAGLSVVYDDWDGDHDWGFWEPGIHRLVKEWF